MLAPSPLSPGVTTSAQPRSIFVNQFLAHFYAHNHQVRETLKFDTVKATGSAGAAPGFRCQLTCPAVTALGQTFPGATFIANAPSRKRAERDAGEMALAALQQAGVLFPSPLGPQAIL
jgi:hypothetical protein